MLWIQGRLGPKTKPFERKSADADANLSPQDKFRTGVFLEIIDSMTGALKKWLDAYTLVRNLFGVCMKSLIGLNSRSAKVQTAWLKHIRKIGNTIWRMNLCSFARSSSAPKQGDDKVSFELRLYSIASAPGVREAFPNINIAVRIYLSLWQRIAQESGQFLYLHESRTIFVQRWLISDWLTVSYGHIEWRGPKSGLQWCHHWMSLT